MNEIENQPAYDLIGDIHGHAEELETLLKTLGYAQFNGHYAHPENRKVIFLGDYIDRGPRIREVLEIVRAMVDGGTALAILGNHEVNALRFHARDSDGRPLRPHTPGNVRQHQATLDQISDPQELAEWLEWLAGLPLFLELDGLRAIHACWDEGAMASLRDIGRLEGAALASVSVKGTHDHDQMSLLVNGPEAFLPAGHLHETADGRMRRAFRVKWWMELAGATCREAIFPFSNLIPDLPPVALPETGYETDSPPTFFGHYALKDSVPSLVQSNLACLDYGMGKGGRLCAYRWDGEPRLCPSKFVMLAS